MLLKRKTEDNKRSQRKIKLSPSSKTSSKLPRRKMTRKPLRRR